VLTAGQNDTLINATNVDGGNVTVHGTAFTGASGSTLTQGNLTISISGGWNDPGSPYGSTNAPFTSLSSAFQNVLASGDYQDSGNTGSIVYTGLTVGKTYEFQFLVNDSRGCCDGRSEVLTAGNSVTVTPYATGGDGTLGTFVNGTFTADATSQTITVGPGSGNQQINGVVLIQTPEPSTLMLGGLGLVGLLVAVRRRRKA
jgi:hypothetical protein